jgi:hypothetical protein
VASDLLSKMAGVGVGPPTPVEGHDLLACRRLLDGLGIGEQVNRALRRVVAEAQLTSWPPPQQRTLRGKGSFSYAINAASTSPGVGGDCFPEFSAVVNCEVDPFGGVETVGPPGS